MRTTIPASGMLLTLTRSAFFAWTAGVLYASFAPPNTVAPPFWLQFPHADKCIHIAMYFGFALLLSLSSFVQKETKKIRIELVISVLLGGLIEVAQGLLTNNRSADIFDFLANATGAACSLLMLFFVRKKLNARCPM